ncbi:4-hydroxy-tetrahydrodipicolinate reductase [uncultured Gulosibacter sp.]|uniref:4-hydroxy-tetrahydrodipicolinate reductase n=1 Tax=uncultured Gulosibacter sp. TaxID=1339167 RepID=UPI0028893CC5|nr:4-hydroxy-tetrahydrodipicolinate reductase [uncultured Gulosibacter sp.]
MTISIAITGATGRMGRLISDLIAQSDEFALHAQLDSSSDLDEMLGADVVIDVTNYEVSRRVVDFAVHHGSNVVVGTSGWNSDRIAELESRLPADRGVIIVPNFSIGSVLGTQLAIVAAKLFESVEIIESHHDGKIDSPSGTAVRTAEAIAHARQTPLAPPFVQQRARGEVVAGVPIHSLRLRGVVADQRVIFGGVGETLEIRHETLSADAYAYGITRALHAAPQVRGVTVGLEQLLGLNGRDARGSDAQ